MGRFVTRWGGADLSRQVKIWIAVLVVVIAGCAVFVFGPERLITQEPTVEIGPLPAPPERSPGAAAPNGAKTPLPNGG